MKLSLLLILVFSGVSSMAQNAGEPSMDKRFVKHILTSNFLSEGVAVADSNNDGKDESPAFVDVDGDGRADLLCNDPVAKLFFFEQKK